MKWASVILVLGGVIHAQELPTRDANGPLEFEPDLQLYNVKPEPNAPGTEAWAIPADVAKAGASAERAKLKAARWEALQKKGIVSKVELEQAVSAANRASVRYQQARVAQLSAALNALKERASRGEASADLVQSAETALQTAKQLAEAAEATARKIEVEFAQNNIERQRKLAAVGLGSKRQIQRAETKLEQLKPK